ncbi:unnamed protein product [Enterobius vermicularis]|uniref:Chitin-binding type-2 domain-containing protein n=1 Tax=Enterobius vermicularis TaxID=51028 RepID=A0A0N4VL73_ENTVE|nr:unnamed protein product [Enterobius vermicularis]
MYSLGCLKEYLACSGGSAFIVNCPFNTVFDQSVKQCLPKDKVPTCQREPTLDPIVIDVLLESKRFVEEDVVPPLDIQKSICSELGDGHHGHGCSSHFIACLMGVPRVMTCGARLRYDEASKRCLAPAAVESCASKIPDVVTVFNAKAQKPGVVREKMFETTVLRKPVVTVASPINIISKLSSSPLCSETAILMDAKTEEAGVLPLPEGDNVAVYISCQFSNDGVYSLGCVPQYIICVQGVGKLLTCPNSSLVFDEDTLGCQPPTKVAACIAQKLNVLSRPMAQAVNMNTTITAAPEVFRLSALLKKRTPGRAFVNVKTSREMQFASSTEAPVILRAIPTKKVGEESSGQLFLNLAKQMACIQRAVPRYLCCARPEMRQFFAVPTVKYLTKLEHVFQGSLQRLPLISHFLSC